MIAELKNIVDLVTSAVRSAHGLKKKRQQKELFADLLEAHYHFMAIRRCAATLLDLAGAQPVERVGQMSIDNAKAYANTCLQLITEQQARLHRLNALVVSQPVLDVFGTDFRQRVDDAIGDKLTGLLGVVAAVEFYLIGFGGPDSSEVKKYGPEMAAIRHQGNIITLMLAADREAEVIDVDRARINLRALESAGDELRQVIVDNCDPDLLIELSAAAEKRSKGSSK